MSEFLTGLSSGQPLVWALFVLGVMATAALTLSAFWAAVFRVAGAFRGGTAETDGDDVLP